MKKVILCITLAFLCSCGNEESTTGQDSVKTENTQQASEAKFKWEYNESKDKMGDVIKFAQLESDDVLDFEFPYDGGANSSLIIRGKGKKTDVIYKISKGQIISANPIGGGSVRVKFDDATPFKAGVIGSSDLDSEVIFFQNPKKIIDKIKSSKRMVIEVEFYNEGNRQIQFDVDGLKWE